jgi:O-antigen ligase
MQIKSQRNPMDVLLINKNKNVKFGTWLLVLYLFFAPLDFIPVISGVSLTKVLIFLPLIGCFVYIKHMRIQIDKFFIFPLLYLMFLTITIFYSYDQEYSKQSIMTIGLNIAAILVLSMIGYNEKEIKIIKDAVVLSGWFTLLLMVFFGNTSTIGDRLVVIVNGAYQDPNYLTGFLIFTIIYYFNEFMLNKKIIPLVKMGIFLTFVLLTGSRGGLIAILGSVLFYIIFWMKKKGFKLSSFITIISFIFILMVLFNIAIGMLPENVAQRYDISYTMNDKAAGREVIWTSIIGNFKQSPVFNQFFGWGAGTIQYFNSSGAVAHNVWIESLMEIGVIGTFILFGFYFVYFIKACKIREYVIASTFIGYMIMGLSMSLISYKPIWNILLFILILKNNKKSIIRSNI